LIAVFSRKSETTTMKTATSDVGESLRTGLVQRVLIVEDEGLIAMDMADALTAGGFEVLGTVDTEFGAVEASQRLRPDVVLMDITLRVGNGIAAARSIMNTSSAQVIFVSGNSDPRTLAAAEAVGAAGFIRKPFSGSDLPLLVTRLLAQKHGN
jgi:two-component system, response regulator PdtaR